MLFNKNCCNNTENKLIQSISCICKNEYQYFLNKKNVVGIGLGFKVKNGFYTNQLCIQVFVNLKLSSNKLSSNDMIPLIYKGIPTDVKETGIFIATSLKNKVRPVLGGYSISSLNNTKGTAGCLVTNGVQNFVLSTNHLLANENMLPIGSPIVQPAYFYGGRAPNDVIGNLYKYIPLREIEGEFMPINFTDCAIGTLTDKNILSPDIALIGRISCVKSPKLQAPVKKVGATTELTTGVIQNINVTTQVRTASGRQYLFKDSIFTSKMAEEGDSGSILINNNNCAIGLLFGNSTNNTVFNRLDTVLDQLDVHLVI